MYVIETAPNVFAEVTGDVRAADRTVPFGNLPLMSDEDLASVGVYRVDSVVPPVGQSVVRITYERGASGVAAMATFADPSREDLRLYAAKTRWQKEVGGVTVSGMPVATDDRSKLLLAGARTKAKEDATVTKRWKGDAGWIELTAPQLIQIGDIVDHHVTACFDLEEEASAGIEAGTITSYADIDAAFAALSTAY